MGRFACELLTREPGFTVACEIHRDDDLRGAVRAGQPELGLDLTVAGRGAQHGRILLEEGVRPVIGTSGLSQGDDTSLDTFARELDLGGLVVPNFSVGVWLQQRLALEAARFLPSVEILEEHRPAKRDSPSGTALDTARQLEAALGREAGSIPIHATRIDGVIANQTVLLGGVGELLRLEHRTLGLEAFAAGLLASLRYARQATGVQRGVGHALEWAAAQR